MRSITATILFLFIAEARGQKLDAHRIAGEQDLVEKIADRLVDKLVSKLALRAC